MFHERIKKLREETGMSQKEFAASMDMEQSKYNKWENGKNAPDYDGLCLLAERFDVSVDYLLGRTDIPSYDQDTKDNIIRNQEDIIMELRNKLDRIQEWIG